jgi:glucose/arabinose dehydrogenase
MIRREMRVMAALFVTGSALLLAAQLKRQHAVLTGKAAFTDYTQENPGVFHKITLADLPLPLPSESVDNPPNLIPRPANAWPKALPGFTVQVYASELNYPRLIRTAPNGDLFLAESHTGEIKVFRGIEKDGRAQHTQVFASGLNMPFGIAFYPPGPAPRWIYVANTDSVVRFPYQNGDLKARGARQVVVPDLPSGGHLRGGGHWTRDIAFSLDGKKMYVSVGSFSNNDDSDNNAQEALRADILEFTPEGTGRRVYAYGLRNAVGIVVQPETGALWASVNERDELGDNLPPDYVTRVSPQGFYGWPWFYMGGAWDPKHKGKHPELKNKVATPNILLQPHSASLEMVFYEGNQFPAEYRGDIFAAQHGSWNRSKRTGYEIIRVPLNVGQPNGEYEDFLTGFVTPDGKVWGRPVGVAVGKDGSLFVSDDASKTIWRVAYTRK